jgi:hypothetical protein
MKAKRVDDGGRLHHVGIAVILAVGETRRALSAGPCTSSDNLVRNPR